MGRIITILSFCIGILLLGCYKVTIYNTPTPVSSDVSLRADWSQIPDDITIPSQYVVSVNGNDNMAYKINREEALRHIFDPGTYNFFIYSADDNVKLNSKEVFIESSNDTISGYSDNIFWTKYDTTFYKDRIYNIKVVMKSVAKPLYIDLAISEGNTDRIVSISGSISGVARGFNFETQSFEGNSSTAIFNCKVINGRIQERVALLGIIGQSQFLVLSIKYNDGSETNIKSDLTGLLEHFNEITNKPMSLKGSINMPIESEVDGTIINWDTENGNVDL
ncbi:MAG: hypothetical protein ACRDDZ_10780 [Marinifilaceae bacterium]